mgnify:CR=1 FL=1
MLALVLAAVFAGTVLLIVAAYVVVNRRQLVAGDVLRARLAPTAPMGAAASILKHDRFSGFRSLNRMLDGKEITASVAVLLSRAGSRLSVGEFGLLSLVCAGLGFLVGHRIGLLAAPLVAIMLGCIPYLYLKRKETARFKQFQAQLPDAIDMLVNAMKSGYSLQAVINFAGDEMPEPLGPEFARVHDEQRLGLEMRNALRKLQERVDTLDCKMFVT